jgi:hypothetical protein
MLLLLGFLFIYLFNFILFKFILIKFVNMLMYLLVRNVNTFLLIWGDYISEIYVLFNWIKNIFVYIYKEKTEGLNPTKFC